MNRFECCGPLSRRRIVADYEHGRPIGVLRFTQQYHGIIDIAKFRIPQHVGQERQLLVGPQKVVEDLSPAFVGYPHDDSCAGTMQSLQQHRQLAGAFFGTQGVKLEMGHGE